MALTERESADKHTNTSRRMQREADIQPPSGGRRTQPIMSESVGKASLVLLILDPRQASERASLKLLTKEDEFSENFSHLVLRFTDGTYDELKKSGGAASAGCDAGLLRDSQNAMRHDRMLKYNLDGRILEDVLGSDPSGLFVAFIHGERYNGKELLFVDPHGAPNVAPEEVELMTYDENKLGLWT